MAGRGPVPQATHQRERDTRRSVTSKEAHLVADGEVRGPTIRQATGRNDWGARATAYWETWRTSPQAQLFADTDWQRLAMIVPLVELYWDDGGRMPDKQLLAEIRLNEERLGATVQDRQRLRMKIAEAEKAAVVHIVADSPLSRIAR